MESLGWARSRGPERGGRYIQPEKRVLSDLGAALSVGSVGDRIDIAVAESNIGLYKTELIRRNGPWLSIVDVELATLTYIDWFNH